MNFDRDLELTGNDWLQKITQPNFDSAKRKEAKEKEKKKKEAKQKRQREKAKKAKQAKSSKQRLSESTESGTESKAGFGTILWAWNPRTTKLPNEKALLRKN